MPGPEDALRALAFELRAEGSVIAPHVRDPDAQVVPVLGLAVAAGPRVDDPPEYALLFESVREAYLLHYGAPRLLAGIDADLALLAGDHLYALGLRRLAGLGDLDAVRELADLISLSAQLNAELERGSERAAAQSKALWLASAVAVGCGAIRAHEEAKAGLRAGAPDAAAALWSAAAKAATGAVAGRLRLAADAIDFRPDPRS